MRPAPRDYSEDTRKKALKKTKTKAKTDEKRKSSGLQIHAAGERRKRVEGEAALSLERRPVSVSMYLLPLVVYPPLRLEERVLFQGSKHACMPDRHPNVLMRLPGQTTYTCITCRWIHIHTHPYRAGENKIVCPSLLGPRACPAKAHSRN